MLEQSTNLKQKSIQFYNKRKIKTQTNFSMFITVAVIPRRACNICYALDYIAKSYQPSLLISKEKESSVIHLYYSVPAIL